MIDGLNIVTFRSFCLNNSDSPRALDLRYKLGALLLAPNALT